MSMNLSPNDFATFCRLKDELVVANNHIRDLEAKNKLLVDKLAREQLLSGSLLPAHAELQIKELEDALAKTFKERDQWATKYKGAEQRIKELEKQLLFAKNIIRDLEAKGAAGMVPKTDFDDLQNRIEQLDNQVLLAQNRYNALSVNYDDLVAKYEQAKDRLALAAQQRNEQAKDRLALAAQQRNESDCEAAHWHKQFIDLNDEYVKLKQKHQVTVEELEELQQKCDFGNNAKKGWSMRYKSLEKDFDNYRNEFDERNTKLMIKLGLAHNQSVDLLVATNLIVANLLSEADLDWSVIAAMMQTVGSLNHTLEELSHV